jgi:hypothetical protein
MACSSKSPGGEGSFLFMGALACCGGDADDTIDDGSYPSEASTVVTGLTVHPTDAGDDVGRSSSDGSVGLLPDVDASVLTGDASPEASTDVTGLVASPTDAAADAIFHGLVAHPGDTE